MAEPHVNHSLFAECLAAMAVSGDSYPCELLVPLSGTGGAFSEPSPAQRVATMPLRQNQRS
jgi:hypothetical protein